MAPSQKNQYLKHLYDSLCSCTWVTCKNNDLILLGTLFHQTSFLCLLSTATYTVAKYSHIKGIENGNHKRQREI